ncbi:molybdopterin-dependent oxidoreductase alpha subunit [Roseivirga pacifica]|uniref:Oxidoreductase alpha (Molybdopterin) subunit n=1 Tax=Roseivirga pacifica TaxID=1267423 RepID=A0A1I0R957_9BACT|nr:FdhF/YdeP family oxidoreductase [Roseivirga pacifica]RKQ49219.1 molybdopterin-dependent oxidoreductase alpha subunit [Roseivirga pacifica]SEW37097.1 oxidoreductase alpha (molybdopterin) subunit [Roseivirga pacifica]
MSESKDKEIKTQPPEEFTGLKQKAPKETSVGKDAIFSALGQMNKYMKKGEALKLSLKINQKGGFDCPGCAWPDPDDERSKLGEYCENGIKAIAEERSKKTIGADFFAKHSVQELSELSDFELGKKGRLLEPLVLEEGATHYKPIKWEDAFQLIADELNKLPSPDEAIFYTSGRTSNEAAYLYQLFVRAYGTNNMPDCSNMCHESSGVGLSETVGIGKGSVTLEDIHQAEVLLIMGQNPGTNHPRMLSALEKCKVNGGQIITVNPLPEAGLMHYTDPQSPKRMLTNGIELTDLFLPVRINGDVAFLKALMFEILQMDIAQDGGLIDHDFIDEYTEGYEQFITAIRNIDYMACLRQCGLEAKQVRAAAKIIAKNEKIIVCWAMGLTQHENGVDNIKEVVNLLLMKGAIGKPGAGTCPVRGHSNVQGDRTMGIWEEPKPEFLDKLDEIHGIKAPRAHGYSVVPAINAMKEGKAKFFFAMGGNFLSATPDTEFTAKALQNCDLTVHVSTKPNRSHLIHGKKALILPCLGRTDKDIQNGKEQFVSCENSMGVVQSSKGALNPPSKELLSEVRIVAELAKATLKNSSINWNEFANDYDNIRDAVEQTIPGFEDYNKRVRQPAGFYLPNGARERKFNTDTGKAKFSTIPLPKHEQAEDEYIMMTIRSHDQYNTTIYGLDDRYRGIYNERRVVMMNEADMKAAGIQHKEVVNLSSEYNGVMRYANKFLAIPYPIPRGNVATYFPEANPLVPIDSFAAKSKTPASKRVRIRIHRANG